MRENEAGVRGSLRFNFENIITHLPSLIAQDAVNYRSFLPLRS